MPKPKNYRDRIGVSRLDENSKSEMYKRFEKVGGKVVQMADPKAEDEDLLTNFVRKKKRAEEQKQAKSAQNSEVHTVQNFQVTQGSVQSKNSFNKTQKQVSTEKKRQKQAKKMGSSLGSRIKTIKIKQKDNTPISYLASKLACIFGGIFNLFGTRIHRRFFRLILMNYKNFLEENKPLLISLLYQDPIFSKMMRKRLDKEGRPYYFEILYRLDTLYDEAVFQSLF